MKRLLLVFSLVIVAWAQTNPMVGRWRGSNGMSMEIPPGSGPFQLVWHLADGKRVTHPAHWVKPGQEFGWTDKQGSQHTATFDAGYKVPRIKDVGEAYPDSPAYWYPVK